MGRADPLETASLLVTAGHHDPQRALAAVTEASRAVLGLDAHAISINKSADFVLLPGPGPAMAVASASQQRTVFRAGRIVARTKVATEFEHTIKETRHDWN
jgi:cytosine deaminase